MLFFKNKYICFNFVAVRIKFGQKLDSQSWRANPFLEQNWIRQPKNPDKKIFFWKINQIEGLSNQSSKLHEDWMKNEKTVEK